MSTIPQIQKIINFLKEHESQKFTARQIAEAIVKKYSNDYQKKRDNPRLNNDSEFIQQIISEIGALKNLIVKKEKHIFWQDTPRPRTYWFNPNKKEQDAILAEADNENGEVNPETTPINEKSISEHDLYPILMQYLYSELNLYCQRIDEKRSKNSRGTGGNQWLHPDIVAMQPIDKEWNDLVRNCVKIGTGQRIRLWSFEVKKELNGGNARKSFFQAVSNSSWANEGYLVATSVDPNIVQELKMLSALHGIGVIVLNPENPSESDMILPSQPRPEVDWQSVNRILTENTDFKEYIELVSTYYQTGRIRAKDWYQYKP